MESAGKAAAYLARGLDLDLDQMALNSMTAFFENAARDQARQPDNGLMSDLSRAMFDLVPGLADQTRDLSAFEAQAEEFREWLLLFQPWSLGLLAPA